MKMHELFDTPEKWTTGFLGRDVNSEPINPTHENAVSWCLLGGIYKCYTNDAGAVPKFKEICDKIFSGISEIDPELTADVYYNKECVIANWNNDIATFEDIQQLTRKLDI